MSHTEITELFAEVELHISAHVDLKPSLRKKIKAAGGSFSDSRGHTCTRYVQIPSSDSALFDEVCALGPRTIIGRMESAYARACFGDPGVASRSGHVGNLQAGATVLSARKGAALTRGDFQAFADATFGSRTANAQAVLSAMDEWEARNAKAQAEAKRKERLADAAPALLEALEAQEEFWAMRERELGALSKEAMEVRAIGAAAIAKAKGGAQ